MLQRYHAPEADKFDNFLQDVVGSVLCIDHYHGRDGSDAGLSTLGS